MRDLETVWAELEADDSLSSGLLVTRADSSCPADLYLAVDKPQNARAILLEVDPKAVPPGLRLPSSAGLDVEVSSIALRGTAKVRVALRLRQQGAAEVFQAFAADLVGHVVAAVDSKTALVVLGNRLAAWQRFFENARSKGLDHHAQQGLYAELWVLRNVLLPSLPPAIALSAWTGSRQATQDFQLKGCAIEVKSSAANAPVRFRIASTSQLELTAARPLFLFAVLLDVRPGAGESLYDAVAATRALIESRAQEALPAFEDRLLEVGYLESGSVEYSTPQFCVRADHVFEVKPGFPG